jgi:hypothetical protein
MTSWELDASNETAELVSVGYSGRLVLLSLKYL